MSRERWRHGGNRSHRERTLAAERPVGDTYKSPRGPRVLLFVQNGDGKPKCYGRVPGPEAIRPGAPGARTSLEIWQSVAVNGGLDDYSLYTDRQDDAWRAADRWWLVACENAEAGRRTIAVGADLFEPDGRGYPALVGRILASGGKESET